MDLVNGEIVLALEVARIILGGHGTEGLVVSSVGSEASNNLWTAGIVEDLLEDRHDQAKIVVPTEPATMSDIKVACNVIKLSHLL